MKKGGPGDKGFQGSGYGIGKAGLRLRVTSTCIPTRGYANNGIRAGMGFL